MKNEVDRMTVEESEVFLSSFDFNGLLELCDISANQITDENLSNLLTNFREALAKRDPNNVDESTLEQLRKKLAPIFVAVDETLKQKDQQEQKTRRNAYSPDAGSIGYLGID